MKQVACRWSRNAAQFQHWLQFPILMHRSHQQPLNALFLLGIEFHVSAILAIRFFSIFAVFPNDSHTNFQCLVFHGIIVRKKMFHFSWRHSRHWATTTIRFSQNKSSNFCSRFFPKQSSFLGRLKKVDEVFEHRNVSYILRKNYSVGTLTLVTTMLFPTTVCWAESLIYINGRCFDDNASTFWWYLFAMPELKWNVWVSCHSTEMFAITSSWHKAGSFFVM